MFTEPLKFQLAGWLFPISFSSITPGKEGSSLGNLIPPLRISLQSRKIDKAFIILGCNQLYSVEYNHPFIRNHTRFYLACPKSLKSNMRWCSAVSSYFPHFLQVGWFIEKDFHPLCVFASSDHDLLSFWQYDSVWIRSYASWRRAILLNHFAHLVYGL